MSPEVLDDDQKDALQEIANIAMGIAGAGLAKVLESFVRLSVPRIRIVETSRISDWFLASLPSDRNVSAVRQAFYGQLEGEVVALFGEDGCNDLADLLGHQHGIGQAINEELLLDVSNILIGATMNGIVHQLGSELSFSAPAIMCSGVPFVRVFAGQQPICTQALLIQIDFSLEARKFSCHLLTFLTAESFEPLRKSLSRFLEGL
jgi:chemotaxis protein CheC